jgi:hypothetical protein
VNAQGALMVPRAVVVNHCTKLCLFILNTKMLKLFTILSLAAWDLNGYCISKECSFGKK